MTTETDPIVGQWYFLPEKGEPYQVTAFDEDLGTIAMENVDGDTESLDIDTWYTLDLQSIEDPSGMDDDDLGVDLDDDLEEDFEDEVDDDWGDNYDE